jgi:cytochrome c peroxidase
MNNTPEMAVKTLKSMPGYIEAFKEAFPHEKDPVTFENMASVIVAFLEATTGDQPVVDYPIQPASTDSTPRPKLD